MAKPRVRYSFRNWAGNQKANPAQIFHPKTVDDLIEIVHKAKSENLKIRCVATGHTWSSSSVVNDDGFLVVVKNMDKIFEPVHVEGDVWNVEIETGVTVKDLDDFLRKHDPPLTMACNVDVDCIRYGGILSMGCHGAATHTRSLTDLVDTVKIIDASGTMNTFSKKNDSAEFCAAALNLGLFGIIYTYTLRIEPMFKLQMRDTRPPLHYYFGSPHIGGPRLKAMVLGNDQTQLFYWPSYSSSRSTEHERVWVKEWHRTDLPYPRTTPLIGPRLWPIAARNADQNLYAPNAIHFWGGMEHLRSSALEMSIKADENFENVVKSWNYVIDQVHELAQRNEFPLNIMLEVRFLRASQMIMSSMYDEDPEAIFATMELVSAANTKGFEEFSSKVAQHWMENYRSQPHWAKMWEHIPGIVPYLKKQAGERYKKFEAIRKKYDPDGMFMNGTFAQLLSHKCDLF
ncbi:hypothetical protein BGZ99_007003 [Dissophora globulifera]|uniref:D-arabinono-1,4-lactone oxidase n=1 Tax=Dissophora globulifera TaxID=979702 RepID=A0A9P6UQD0_9FUNG|nr:hypothetical protein BGZ99_007003 [Dissophora globulifera]